MMGKHPTVCEVELAYLPHKTTVLDYLLWLCADRFGFTPEKLKEQNRKKQLSKARKLFCWAAVCYTEFSLPEIGDFLDRDHSSVQKAAMKVGKEASFREDMKWLEGEL